MRSYDALERLAGLSFLPLPMVEDQDQLLNFFAMLVSASTALGQTHEITLRIIMYGNSHTVLGFLSKNPSPSSGVNLENTQ